MTITISSQKFSPTFLQNHYPYIFTLSRFSTKSLFRFNNYRKIIINNYLLVYSIKIKLAYVISIRIVFLSSKQLIDSIRFLSQRSTSWQKVTIIQSILNDIVRRHLRRKQIRLFYKLLRSHPLHCLLLILTSHSPVKIQILVVEIHIVKFFTCPLELLI